MSDVNHSIISGDSFLPLVERLCRAHVEAGITPDIVSAASSTQKSAIKWIIVRYRGAENRPAFPHQGWKLHVSAHHMTAEAVLERVVPILSARAIPWKCVPSPFSLQSLNHGEGGLSQIGKFITVYPFDDAESVSVAQELHEATKDLSGPTIPSDRALTPASLVHYRYGGYTQRHFQLPTGQIINAIQLPDGQYVKDVRGTFYQAPEGFEDPFERAGIFVPTPPAPVARLLGKRFMVLLVLHRNARNTVYLTVDLKGGRHAVVKQVALDMRVGRADAAGQDMLRHEARVLEAIGQDEHLPSFYALFEQGENLYLAMEAINGVTMEKFITTMQANHHLPSTAEVVRWSKDLVQMLMPVHAGGWIHCDLKSTNILVTADEQMRLLDFDISAPIEVSEQGTAQRLGFGTRVYESPQRLANAPITIQDDIYGLGAVLYGLAGLCEISQSPTAERPLDRPLTELNPRLHPSLCQVIERCLAPHVEDRYATLAEVAAALDAIDTTVDLPFSVTETTNAYDHRNQQRPLFETNARRLADSIVQIAQPVLEGKAVAWVSTHNAGAGLSSREVNTGTAGTLYTMIEFADKVGDERYYDAVARGAEWLAVAPRVSEPMVPGLYSGEAGIAAVLLRAGQLLNRQDFIEAALRCADSVATAPILSPDLFNGAAGRMRMHLWAWRATGDLSQLAHARQMGEYLIGSVQGSGDHEAYWTFTKDFTELEGQSQFGYAHGTAGIADTLLDLYEATNDERALTLAIRAARWLMAHARPVLNGDGMAWPLALTSDEKSALSRSPFWCHGAAGIGLFLARIGQGAIPEALEYARSAARAVAYTTRWANPTQCHGLSGNIDFLITMYQATGDTTFLDHAYTFGGLMSSFVLERDGMWFTPSEYHHESSPDFMVGYAGVALAFLRLTMPDTFPHPFRDETLQAPVPA